MQIHSKELLLKKSTQSNNNSHFPIEILGSLPTDFYTTNYRLMKRGEYFYAVVNNSPEDGRGSTDLRTKNYISKTKDFVNWTGSKIGSGFTTYDELSDSFYSITLAMHYEGTANGIALVAYHVTKINPDDFSYVNTTVMGVTSMSETSRGITPVQRVGNYLMFLYYKGHTNVFMCYSTDNGSTWTSKQIYTISSFGIGASGLRHVGNGTRSMIMACFGSTSSSVRYFTSPTASAASNCKMCYGDNPINTVQNIFYYDSSNKIFYKTNDLANYSNQFPYKANTISTNAKFYGNYLICACNASYLNTANNQYDHIGKIAIYDITTGELYLFDTGLDIQYLTTSGSNTYCYGNIQIIGLIEDYLYFIFQTKTSSTYKIARVPISYILENMQPSEI